MDGGGLLRVEAETVFDGTEPVQFQADSILVVVADVAFQASLQLAEAIDWLDSDPTIAAVYPRWTMTEDGKVRHTTSGEPFSAPQYLAQPGLIPRHHLTILRRLSVEAMLDDFRGAHPCMVKSQERLLTIGSLRYGRLVPHSALAYQWKLRTNSGRHLTESVDVQRYIQAHNRASLRALSRG